MYTEPFVPPSHAFIGSTSSNSFLVSIYVPEFSHDPVRALIDCGASDCFIDSDFVAALPVLVSILTTPVRLRLFDGSRASHGLINQYVQSPIIFDDGTHHDLSLLVTKLHPAAQVVLGLSWLRKYNPAIDWSTMTFMWRNKPKSTINMAYLLDDPPAAEEDPRSKDPSEVELTEISKMAPWPVPQPVRSETSALSGDSRKQKCSPKPQTDKVTSQNISAVDAPTAPLYRFGPLKDSSSFKVNVINDPVTQPPPTAAVLNQPPPVKAEELKTISRSTGAPSANYWKLPHIKSAPPTSSPAPKQAPPPPPKKSKPNKPQIRLIGAAPFATLIRAGLVETYGTLNIRLHASVAETTPPAVPVKQDTEASILDESLPKIYHDFADVFSESDAKILPPHRAYDHAIDLEDGAKAPYGPLYNMSELELNSLREYLDDMIGKGFIRSSNSSAGAPVLFAKKKDGSLRLCVDYRGLNRVTIKNRYPIPLINNILDRLGKAKLYSKIDLKVGYNNVRIKPGDEWKTAFRTRYGSYEYLVMPFGLTNAPATFQHFMNDTFADMADAFVLVYLDDILIFSDNLEDHKIHVRKVLQRLRETNLHANLKKSEFHCDSIEYLGYIVSPEGIKMDPSKIDVVLSWPKPANVKEVQSFLGFANFYRRFIYNYSKISRPLNNLTRKNTRFIWTDRCQTAFDTLKTVFTTAPILAHFNPENPIIVETDSSEYAIAGILSQLNPGTGQLHPVAFYSRSLHPAELNYDIHDKELLSIYVAFVQWRAYLEGAHHKILVISDHNNLQYFQSTKQLTRRQVRWSEYLSQFDFVIKFRPGRLGTKADALTRRPDVYPKGEDRAYAQANPHNFQSIFKAEHLRSAMLSEDAEVKEIVEHLRASVIIDTAAVALRIRNALQYDEFAKAQFERIRSRAEVDPDNPYTISDDELLLRNGLIYVPDHDNLRLEILQIYHDHKLSGHPGIRKTVQLIHRRYFWPKITHFVTVYIRSCSSCARAKSTHHKPYGPLKFLPIPDRPWSSISMDFIEGLPLSEGFDSILVVVCRLTKAALFIECNTTDNAPKLAQLYLKNVFSKHGVPHDIVSDRGKLFVSKFWESLCKLLSIKSNLSTAYHPETDGQTERVNQVLEQYLRFYINYQQDDWVSLLPLAEFAYNNTPHSATQVSPFFANKGYHPKFEIGVENVSSYAAQQVAEDLGSLHEYLKEQIQATIGQYVRATADRRIPPPEFKVGSKVWLNAKNIKTKRPMKKLDHRRLGPFKIVKQISSHAYRLELPAALKLLHDVFHIDLLEPVITNTIPNRRQPPPPPTEIDQEQEFDVSAILDSRKRRGQLQYLVEWAGYEETPEHQTWEPLANLTNAMNYVRDFHRRYPNKPKE